MATQTTDRMSDAPVSTQPNEVGTDQPSNLDLRFKARLARIHQRTEDLSMPTPPKTMEWWVFTFDPFQARTSPVFESIYRYGREFVS